MDELEPKLSGERYDDMWWSLHRLPEAAGVEPWLRRLEGQTVVDLGSGRYTAHFQQFLKSHGAKSYIAVDMFPDKDIRVLSGHPVAGDMLALTKRFLPNAGYSIAMNGINANTIDPSSDYGQKLAQEMVRLLHPEGLVLGVGGGGILKELSYRERLKSRFVPIDNVLGDPDNGFYFLAKTDENS